ncbi:MAG: PhzF family phenazine biosynthesis protein [Deltaproteobacteria bacterium]|nr:PhzF family phenazine biosynthesis protein [Deltaproteobacteria bacterium]
MKKLRFKKIDAFASKHSSGNPAAVVYLDQLEELSEDEKMQIAKELKGFVSEVGYVCPGTETDYELCYFSSEREVAFCGHATIAIMNDIIANNEALHSRTLLLIATRTDRLQVENRYRDEKSVYISAPPARFSMKEVGAADVAAALNSRLEDLDPSRPIQMINGGLETLIVPMKGLEPILRVTPDLQTLKQFCLRIGADIVLLYSSEVAFPESRYRTRVFAPPYGYLEDPATGSGNSALGYYLLAHGIWEGDKITIEQNGFRDAPNFVRIFSPKTGAGDSRVWFGGGAIVRMDGQYNLE